MVVQVVMAPGMLAPAAAEEITVAVPAESEMVIADTETFGLPAHCVGKPFFYILNINIMKKISRETINGFRVTQINEKDLPFSIVSIWLKVGSRNDPLGKEGLAHFSEHLMCMETRSQNKDKRLLELESQGINYYAYTTREAMVLYQIQENVKTNKSLKILLNDIKNQQLSAKTFISEKKVIIDESNRIKSDPMRHNWFLKDAQLWPNSDIGRYFFGDEKSIRSIKMDDINNFKNIFLNKNNLEILIINSSGIDRNIFNDFDFREDFNSALITKDKAETEEPIHIFINDIDDKQITVGIYFRGPNIKNHREKVVFDFIREYLANNWTSRFNKILRLDKGNTYWVNSDTEYFTDTGYIGFVFSTVADNLEESLDCCLKEIDDLNNGLIDKNSFLAIKEILVSNIIIGSYISDKVLWWYGWPMITGGKMITRDEYINEIRSISPEELSKIAAKYLKKDRSSIVISGKIGERQKKRLLKI